MLAQDRKPIPSTAWDLEKTTSIVPGTAGSEPEKRLDNHQSAIMSISSAGTRGKNKMLMKY